MRRGMPGDRLALFGLGLDPDMLVSQLGPIVCAMTASPIFRGAAEPMIEQGSRAMARLVLRQGRVQIPRVRKCQTIYGLIVAAGFVARDQNDRWDRCPVCGASGCEFAEFLRSIR
jgi:hypothetical protein